MSRFASEFAFELSLCAALEEHSPRFVDASDPNEGGDAGDPNDRESDFEDDLDRAVDPIVSRQLGGGVCEPGGRVLDVVQIEPGPAFDRRAAITPETIPDAVLDADVGPGRARYWRKAFDGHPDADRRALERAVEIGALERERRNGREYVRQVARYPDRWFGRIRAIENKPDLEEPGDLETQLRTDVSLGLVDEAILATASYVTGAHRNRLPAEVGIWRFNPDSLEIEVIREPTPLRPDGPGVELLATHPGRSEIAVVLPEAKARARRRLAERAYGKGWRTYSFPGCAKGRPTAVAGATLPGCAWKECVVDAASECGPSCPEYDPTAPASIDLESERARRTGWDPRSMRGPRRQSGLDRFRDD